MRLAMLKGCSVGELVPQLGALADYTAETLPLALWILKYTMYRAKFDGSLANY
jgi:hypothetical protein